MRVAVQGALGRDSIVGDLECHPMGFGPHSESSRELPHVSGQMRDGVRYSPEGRSWNMAVRVRQEVMPQCRKQPTKSMKSGTLQGIRRTESKTLRTLSSVDGDMAERVRMNLFGFGGEEVLSWQMVPGAALSLRQSLGMDGLRPQGRNFVKIWRGGFDSALEKKIQNIRLICRKVVN
jgi:hypothetical protein